MEFFKRYTRNPSAVLGLALLASILLAAVSAGLLYPDNPLKLAGRPLSQDGGVSVEEADMPLSDLSETYVADVDQEPVNHGD